MGLDDESEMEMGGGKWSYSRTTLSAMDVAKVGVGSIIPAFSVCSSNCLYMHDQPVATVPAEY